MKRHFSNAALCLTVIMSLLATQAAQCAVIRVKTSGLDSKDGSTWTLAKKTIQAAINASTSGDEIWVAAGVYAENVTLKAGVALYGGFLATEASRDQRDWRANISIINAANSGSAVTSPVGATSSTRIDGFRLTYGKGTMRVVDSSTLYYGGGVYCANSSPTIVNNTISYNAATNFGGGIYCSNSSPIIVNNTITHNTAGWSGAGIQLDASSPTIANNIISENNNTGSGFGGTQGGGIFCGASSSPMIVNNTIVRNNSASSVVTGGGISCGAGSSPTIANNIIASNSQGIYSAGSPSVRYNCLFNGNDLNYVGLPKGSGDLEQDPLLVSNTSNLHLQPGSPCLNTGDDTAVVADWPDIDGQARIKGTHVDMGADEYWPAPTVIITYPTTNTTYSTTSDSVTLAGTASDGTATVTWSNDRGGSGICVGTASWSTSGILLQTGQNAITVTAYDSGGFAGTDTITVTLNTEQPNAVFVKPTGNDANDGASWADAKRTVQAGINAALDTQSVWVAAGTYSENIELANGIPVYGGFAGTETSLAQRRFAKNATILDGRGSGHTVEFLNCDSELTRIDGFTIRNANSGVYCENSKGTISNCIIRGNRASSGNGGGVYCTGGSMVITSNLIVSNTLSSGNGGGIYCYTASGSTRIVGNTITGNTADNGGGISLSNCSANMTIANNIVAFNSSGIHCYGPLDPTPRTNDVYFNTGGNYSGLTQGATDIVEDPQFVDRANGDYHLRATAPVSPCINAGTNLASGMADFDMDGQTRINAVVDMGADEVWPDAAVAITSPTSDTSYVSAFQIMSMAGTASESVTKVYWSSDRGAGGDCAGTSSWTTGDVGLAPGTNIITVTAEAALTKATDVLAVFYDSVAPTVVITSPTDQPSYTSPDSTVDLGGSATDDVGIASLTWANDRGGSGACVGTNPWVANDIALLAGVNVITVTATDMTGKTATAVISVTYADNVAPTVAITSPTSNPTYGTKNAKITLGGTASDNVAVTGVAWSNDRGGSGSCTGVATWAAADIPLLTGSNVITITAIDAAGNSSTDTLTVTYDSTPPSVSFTTPTDEAAYATNGAAVDIGGAASDDQALAGVRWSNSRGGSGVCIGTTAWSYSGIALQPGSNVITVTATDAAGNTATDTLNVTFTDVTRPSIDFTIPTSAATHSTTTVKLNIGGTASDNAGIASVAWSNNRGGSGACTGGVSWSATAIVLQPGENVITATATDTSGNTQTDTLTVTFTDTNAPTIAITSPTTAGECSRTCNHVSLAGTSLDDVAVVNVTWSNDRGGEASCVGTTEWTATDIPLQPGTNVITVSANDAAGNTRYATITVEVLDISIGAAWQGLAMVSLPIYPDETDPKPVVGFAEDFWASYDSESQTYTKYPGAMSWLDPVTATPVRGFWARFDETPATPCGTVPSQSHSVSIFLMPGWNLIGEPFVKAVQWDVLAIKVRTLSSGLRSLGMAGDTVSSYAWGWDTTAGEYYLVRDQSLYPSAVGELSPWQAYWIKAKKECELILPAP